MSKPQRQRLYHGYAMVLFSALIMLVIGGTFFSFGVFFKPLSADFGWPRALTAGAFSLSTVLKGLFYVFTGRLNDRFGPRVVMSVCGLFLGLGYLLMSRLETLWELYLFLGVVVAIGMSGGWVPLVSTVSRWFVKRRGMMSGIVLAGSSLGTLLGPPISNWLISSYAWRSSYLILGIAALVAIIVPAQFLRRDPGVVGLLPYGEEPVKAGGSDSPEKLSLKMAVGTVRFWGLLITTLSAGFGMYLIIVHIVPHAIDLGISPAGAAGIMSVIGGAGVVGRVVLGGIGDRVGHKNTFAACFVLMSAALALVLVATELWWLYLFALLFGVAAGGMLTLQGPLVADLFGLGSHGTIMGSAAFATDAGGAIGTLLAGYIFDLRGSYQLAFLISLGLCLMGLILVGFLKPAPRGHYGAR